MVGLPLNVENSSYENLFPNAVTNTLFSFNGQYVSEENLIPGTGYWLRFPEDGNVSISGSVITDLQISIMEGWNLISGISTVVTIQNIIDPNDLIIPGTIYGFEDGYVESESIEPGYGYWLRSTGEGEIILSTSSEATRMVTAQKPDNANTLKFRNHTLYFGNKIEVENPLSFSLPPKPPTGARDLRFSGDTKLCSTEECVIEVMNNGSPLMVNCNINDGKNWELIPVIASEMKWSEAISLFSDEQITFNPEVEQWILRKSLSAVPSTFALHPAYPNPFNPVTTISFSIPNNGVKTQHAASLQIYDITGKLVETLMDEPQEPGYHTIQWNANNFSSGVYFIRLESGTYSQSQKLILLK